MQQYHITSTLFLTGIITQLASAHLLHTHISITHPNIQLPQIIRSLPEITTKMALEQDKIELDMKRLANKMRNTKFQTDITGLTHFDVGEALAMPHAHRPTPHSYNYILYYLCTYSIMHIHALH